MQQIPPPNSLYHSDRSKRLRTALAVLLLLLLAASLVPVLLVGRYARASADDYSYGFYTHYAVQNGQCLLPAIWRMVWGNWRTWQGSFSAMALMTITPCIFSEQLYWLTPVVMLASLLLGTFKLSRTLVCRCSGGDWRDWICTAATMLLLSIQLIPSPLNSFYWWNGACYYTFTYGVGLLYLDAFANVLLRPERPRWRLIPGLLCGIFVGGSNYVSALLCLLVGGLLLLASLWLRRARGRAAALLLSLAVPFLLSVAAPGNHVRQSGLPSLPQVQAVAASVLQAARYWVHWLEWPVLLLCLAWIPLLFRLAGRCPCRFRWPGAFAVLAFLLFAAQNAPHFYAASTAGPMRLRNIVYLSFYWLLLLNEWYFLGWFRRRVLPRIQGALRVRRWAGPLWAAALSTAIVLCTAVQFPDTLTAGCLRELSNGTVAAYAAERDSRLPALLDPSQTDVRFPAIVHQSPLLYPGDISTDPGSWTNQALAAFYGKASVALYPSRK